MRMRVFPRKYNTQTNGPIRFLADLGPPLSVKSCERLIIFHC